MKALVLIFTILLAGCAVAFDPSGLPDFETPEDVAEWVYDNITWTADIGEFWQYPQETLDRRAGDCEDQTILTLSLLYDRFGIEGQSEVIYYSARGRFHMRPLLKGKSMEPVSGIHTYYHVITYSRESVMNLIPVMRGGSNEP
jgi:hypothetical protein